jgi:hypothetical protein
MARLERSAEHARRLKWEWADGTRLEVELHQVDAARWHEDPLYHTTEWHCVPARAPGQVIAARASLK